MEALPEQQAFIERDYTMHAVLVAGAGTGKTWTLERRSEYLVSQGVPEEAVAILTLTRTMARELSERIPYGRAQTLHAFALSQLNRLRDAWGYRVADPWEVRNLVVEDLKLGCKDAFSKTASVLQVQSFLERMARSFREGQDEPRDLTALETQLLLVFQQQRQLFRYRVMDELVDDLIRLIEQGTRIPMPPSHILVDEYQDLTAGELRLLQLLAEERGTVINACGDDRQSIYGFREADELALHRFAGVYGVNVIDYLWHSRRCSQAICDFANALEKLLPTLSGLERHPLAPWPGLEEEGRVRAISTPGPMAEAKWVVRECRASLANGVPAGGVMVVVASYYDQVFANLKRAADEEGEGVILFHNPRRPQIVAGDLAVRILSAAARLHADENDQMAWRTLVWATPDLGDARLTRLLTAGQGSYLANLRQVAGGDAVCARALAAGEAIRNRYGQEPTLPGLEAVRVIAEALGLTELSTATLERLIDGLPEALEPEKWLGTVFEVSEELEAEEGEVADSIPVRTVFQAKGLQAEVVFLVNAIDESFSRFGSVADGVRRLYVAATRARIELNISAPRWIRYTGLGHAVGRDAVALADMVVGAAQDCGVAVEVLESG